ncbi:HAUS augmin-like complex subunit 6 [Dunckerocampus dactyliophorus]|uniref:HAUS augmin-like complex subunit 6 n=1 Tax=Dunckerocampus dactyliophorus TaxID=161453 RepID=UPI00240726AC|nr:HAUS augmin-like complex subunit 6 [Dunckerocampus dactyliophorus]
MASQTFLQKQNGKYLWFSLLSLGFQRDNYLLSNVSKTSAKHVNLGPTMFDKPNKDAFFIVINFLLEKLNPTRFQQTYRFCWPVVGSKQDAEFRKVTCAWLRELMDQTGYTGSKMVASLLLSPGGPKFTSLMLHLAKQVMLQEMKTLTTGDGFVHEAAAMPASSLDMASKRLHLAKTRFLKEAVHQDRLLREYHDRAKSIEDSLQHLRAESKKYDVLKHRVGDSLQPEVSFTKKTEMVRSLWTAIDEMRLTTEESQNVLESVVKGAVDQYILDGTDCRLQISHSLLERIEQLPQQLSSGNVYEAQQLNLLCVFELANHALRLLKEERCSVQKAPKPQLNLIHLEQKCQQMDRGLQDLQLLRLKNSKEEIPEVRSHIRDLEAEWDRKWMETLKDTPLVSFLSDDPTPGFLSPMARLSFEPSADSSYGCSIFSQFPAKLPDKSAECKVPEGDGNTCSFLKSSFSTSENNLGGDIAASASPQVNSSLDWLFDTPPSPSPKTPSVPQQATVSMIGHLLAKVTPTRAKTPVLDMECDNLADQFAVAVASTSSTADQLADLDLEWILGTLHGDPFSTRKQLPRTPESLILDIKTSWRKAVEEDGTERAQQALKCNNSITGHLTPLGEAGSTLLSLPGCSNSVCSPSNQQGAVIKSSLLWSTLSTADSLSGTTTGSSVPQFSLDQETLPELPSCDSFLSLDEEEDEPLIHSLKKDCTLSPLNSGHCQIQQLCGGSFVGNIRSPECILLGDTPAEANKEVFSLDLDALDAQSPTKQEYCLPTLITFSPIEDMKC